MAATLREIEDRVLAVMPPESTIDRPRQAQAVALVVFEARRLASASRRRRIAKTRSRLESSSDRIQQLKDEMWHRRD